MRIQTAFSVFILAALSARGEDRLVGGPMAVNVTSKSATISWVVQTGEVKVGEQSIPVLRSDSISITGLKPGSTVPYTLPGGIEGSFKTAPAGPTAFQSVIFGDTRTRHELHQKIAGAIDALSPDFVVHTGDLVTDGMDTQQWPRFFEIEKNLLRKAAFFPVLGNHERNSRSFYQFFDVKTSYYSFDWGAVHFTLLNSDLGNVAMSAKAREDFWAEQTRWLEDDLKKAEKAEFRIVVMHHPPFTAVKRRQNDSPWAKSLTPMFERYKVAAVFSGHDHNYQHHLRDGVHYIVTGGGGAPLYPVDGPIENLTLKVESIEHYVRLFVTPGAARVEAIALDGRILEQFPLK